MLRPVGEINVLQYILIIYTFTRHVIKHKKHYFQNTYPLKYDLKIEIFNAG